MKAQVAELVDALVSNTSERKFVPVRSRPWVQKEISNFAGFLFLFLQKHDLSQNCLKSYKSKALATISAISRTFISFSFSLTFKPSSIIVIHNGQAVAIISALVSRACSVLSS